MEAQKLKNYLFSETSRLYCILDGASVPDLPMRLYETNTPNYCLFRGELEPELVYAAPALGTISTVVASVSARSGRAPPAQVSATNACVSWS